MWAGVCSLTSALAKQTRWSCMTSPTVILVPLLLQLPLLDHVLLLCCSCTSTPTCSFSSSTSNCLFFFFHDCFILTPNGRDTYTDYHILSTSTHITSDTSNKNNSNINITTTTTTTTTPSPAPTTALQKADEESRAQLHYSYSGVANTVQC